MSGQKEEGGSQKSKRYRYMDSYDRPAPSRGTNKKILVVCEGAETEPNYFLDLRAYLKLQIVKVKIEKRGGAPISVVRRAIQIVSDLEEGIRSGKFDDQQFDEVWCVFDVENPINNSSFDQAVNLAYEQKAQAQASSTGPSPSGCHPRHR